MKNELTEVQVDQCDAINGLAYNAMCELLNEELAWNMEWIGELSDTMAQIAIKYFGKTEMEIYPYIVE